MRIKLYYILTFIALAISCSKAGFDIQEGDPPAAADKTMVDASCSVAQLNTGNNSGMMTKAIIGQTTTTMAIEANFIKLDEVRTDISSPDAYSPTAFTSWNDSQTKIVNASIISSPDNIEGFYFRSIAFKPRQTYHYTSIKTGSGDNENEEIIGYITRMVGWYPQTYNVPVGPDGTASEDSFIDQDIFVDYNGEACIKFDKVLDGETDLMVSDMREGRYELSDKGFKNNSSDYDVQPYGHVFKDFMNPDAGFVYCNYFTFNHYLTGIRLFIHAEDSNLSLISWNYIHDVIFPDQPSSATIALPTVQNRDANGNAHVAGTTATLPSEGVPAKFGEVKEWSDPVDMPIIKTAMAATDPDYPEFALTPTYPVDLLHDVSHEKTFLGYILAQPETDTSVRLHTDAGFISITIPKTIDGTDILKAGHIYNIVLNINTNGTLDVVVGNEDDEAFRNLSPYNTKINGFEDANCFIISQDMMVDEEGKDYEGFYFNTVTPGNGDRGFISGLYPSEPWFEPYSARILWQDVPYLVTHVELVHGYLRFTLNEKCRTEGLEGNAVLAIYDEDGNILWSWHIWVVNDVKDITYTKLSYRDYEDCATSDYYLTSTPANKELNNVTIMNMNLGATSPTWSTGDGALEAYGLYYQWGRKDPSPGPASSTYSRKDLQTKTYYYMDGEERNSVYENIMLQPTVETGVKRPLDIMAPSRLSETYANDWLYNSVNSLWGYSTASKAVVTKTIYDPCPYGYRVADDELFALFDHYYRQSSASWSQTSDGRGIVLSAGDNADSDNYFPFSGWKGHDRSRSDKTHAWYEVGYLGDYQDARICRNANNYMNHRGRSMLISSSKFSDGSYSVTDVPLPAYTMQLTRDFANRTSASSVRCVRYNAADQEPSAE